MGFANIVVLKIHRIQLNAKYVARVVMKVITKSHSVKIIVYFIERFS